MTHSNAREPRFRSMTKSVIAAGLALAVAAVGQIPSQLDPRPFGETGRPVGLAGSAFEVWVAYPSTLLQFRRMGDDTPRWFGTNQGLPSEGIAAICYDESTQSLWIRSSTNRWLRWSAGLESSHEETPPAAGCVSRLGKSLDVATIANLNPAPAGWIRMGSDLVDPRGARSRIQYAMSLDDRELWLATDHGVWTGRTLTGRIEPRMAGLAESCATRISPDSSGAVWLQGCEGSFTALVDGNPRATFLATDSRNSDLVSPRLVGASATRGVWVSVSEGLVRLSTDGFEERLLGRKAPFGGRVLSTLETGDTLWVGTQNSLSYRVRSKPFFVDAPPWETPSPVNALHATPLGLLAATNDGFWLRVGTTWMRPSWLKRAEKRTIVHSAFESKEPFRLAWWDGRELRIDTLPGHGGKPDSWLPYQSQLHSMSFDTEGRLHLALGGSWVIWNLQSGETREWKAGLGLTGDIYDVLPRNDRATLAGVGGGASVRIPSYAPPSSKPK